VKGSPIEHRFVTEVPRELEPNVLYVSIEYATAVHLCPGCSRKVVTPFAPGSWSVSFDGETVSINPSIWNRAHECDSHYWIWKDRLIEAVGRWSPYRDLSGADARKPAAPPRTTAGEPSSSPGLVGRVRRLLGR
jgi:hypothetical protein